MADLQELELAQPPARPKAAEAETTGVDTTKPCVRIARHVVYATGQVAGKLQPDAAPRGRVFVSCGVNDNTINIWGSDGFALLTSEVEGLAGNMDPERVYVLMDVPVRKPRNAYQPELFQVEPWPEDSSADAMPGRARGLFHSDLREGWFDCNRISNLMRVLGCLGATTSWRCNRNANQFRVLSSWRPGDTHEAYLAAVRVHDGEEG